MGKEALTAHVHIMYGLPGSGKTWLCKEMMQEEREKVPKGCYKGKYISLDEWAEGMQKEAQKEMLRTPTGFSVEIGKMLRNVLKDRYYPSIYIDGIIRTRLALIAVLSGISKSGLECDRIEFTVHAFKEDRDACEWNDSGRRNRGSVLSIRYLDLESLDGADLDLGTLACMLSYESSISIQEHDVVRKPSCKKWLEDNALVDLNEQIKDNEHGNFQAEETDVLKSKKRSLGGCICDYTGDDMPTDADGPVEFAELFDFLEKISPYLPLNVVRKILEAVETKQEVVQTDFYGGTSTLEWKEIPYDKIYNALIGLTSDEKQDAIDGFKSLMMKL